jgi:hypothetical protein
MSARSAVAVAIAFVGTWAFAGPAEALEPGVFVDPGSPAGKEYSVPLSVLRAGGSGRPAVEGQTQPLFGIGITPAGAHGVAVGRVGHGQQSKRSRGAQPAHGNRGSASRQIGGSGPAGGRRTGGSAVHPPGPVLAGSSTRQGSSAAAVALFTALIVLGGLALGAMLVAARRRLE